MTVNRSRQIVKNTMMLYIRMLLTMVVGLYTSRVVLSVLGVDDYGIYNVVGGIVVLFTFLNATMAASTQRFLSYELGCNNLPKLAKIFSSAVLIHLVIAAGILLLAETVGLWFLYNKIVIPEERFDAAFWVYQFSVFTCLLSVSQLPYDAAIIAREKMSFYAIISMLNAVLKLSIVFLLQVISFDKLVTYAMLIFLVTLLIRIVYQFYCKLNFKECSFYFIWDKSLNKELLSFSSWNLVGNLAATGYGQGVNILLNLFFGPGINAARGIAYQVCGQVQGFMGGFQVALNPQITKSFACGDLDYLYKLIFKGSKSAYYLLFIITLPVLLNTHYLLSLWLKKIPDHTVFFIQLVLFDALVVCLSRSLDTVATATGEIKRYQLVVGGILLMILPFSYVLLNWGWGPFSTMFVSILFNIITLFFRLRLLKEMIGLSLKRYVSEVIKPICIVSVLSPLFPVLVMHVISDDFFRLLSSCFLSLICTGFCIIYLGVTEEERSFIGNKVKVLMNKYFFIKR